jgi:hypothetical protein
MTVSRVAVMGSTAKGAEACYTALDTQLSRSSPGSPQDRNGRVSQSHERRSAIILNVLACLLFHLNTHAQHRSQEGSLTG